MKKLFSGILVLFIIIFAVSFLTKAKEIPLLNKIISQSSDSEEMNDEHDDEEDTVDARLKLADGSLAVKISKDVQQLAGLKTSRLESIDVQMEDKTIATVIDIQELLDLRSEYRNIMAQRDIANTKYKNSSKLLEQLEVLHKEASNISMRELQQAKASWAEDQARVHAANVELENIRENMIQKWNVELTEMALNKQSELFNHLINREEVLVLLSLKADQKLSQDSAFIYVNQTDDRKQAVKAFLVSPAPFADKTLQGESYFFHVNADKLRIGMRLLAWLPETGFIGEGVYIPAEAVIWYAGNPWAYIQVDDESFHRRSLINPIEISDGWLVKENFAAGDKIVIKGAQTLLSEEIKWAIPDEDND